MSQSDESSQFDEGVWRAWIEKNKAQDEFRFARRLRVLGLVAVFISVGALLWRFTV